MNVQRRFEQMMYLGSMNGWTTDQLEAEIIMRYPYGPEHDSDGWDTQPAADFLAGILAQYRQETGR